MGKPCRKCGHPGPFVPKNLPDPDPRKVLNILCAACDRDITYDTHQWKHEPDGRWVCCNCMTPTRLLRNPAENPPAMLQNSPRWPLDNN